MVGHGARLATEDDVEWIVGWLPDAATHYDTKYSLYPGREAATDKVLAIVQNHVAIVSHNGPEKSGFILGFLIDHFMNNDIKLLIEVVWWVTPSFRGTRAGHTLLTSFAHMGKQLAQWIVVGTQSKSPIGPTTFARFGFKNYQHSYVLEV